MDRRATVLILALVAPLFAGCTLTAPEGDGAAAAVPTAVVVAQQALAAEAGAAIITAGGNAIDAAAAVQWALTVVEPQFSGIGGGAFLLYYEAGTGDVYAIDGREAAPAGSTGDQFQHPARGTTYDPTVMGTAVGVPGTLRLWEYALDRWGTLGLAGTMDPAIKLADEGFPMPPHLSEDIDRMRHRLETWPESAALYLPGSVCVPSQAGFTVVSSTAARCTGGGPVAAGSVFRNPMLADSFRLIADRGTDVFYKGEIAEAIVAAQAQREGRMTMADLAAYGVVERTPLRMEWDGYEIVTMDMPSSALTMLQMLRMLEGDDLAASGAGTADTLHLMIEAMHLAYADRAAYMGDEDFVEVPQQGLLHPDYVAQRRALIGEAAKRDVSAGDPWPYEGKGGTAAVPSDATPPSQQEQHTSHFTVIDHAGNIVVSTTTIEHFFGTGMLVPGYGFVLNNELTDFDWDPGRPNEVEGDKRPRSSMTPTVVLQDGEPVLTVGSPGGSTIISTVFQVLLNLLEHGMDLESAVAAPRIYSPSYPTVLWETGIDPGVRSDLEGRGHDLADARSVIGSVQALQRVDEDAWVGVADPRRGGAAIEVTVDR